MAGWPAGLLAGLLAGLSEIAAVGARSLDQEVPAEEIPCIVAVAVVAAALGDPAVDLDSLYIDSGAVHPQSQSVAEKEHFVAEVAVDSGRMPEHIEGGPDDHCCLHPGNCLN